MKFIDSCYDEETGISSVTVQHLGEKFTAEARLHPQDSERASKYTGCSIAEMRARIKALKKERAIAKNKADMALDFVKSLQCYSNFDPESETAKVVYRQLNRRINKVNELADRINSLYLEIQALPIKKAVLLDAHKQMKAKQEN